MSELSVFERNRLENIRKNQEILQQLALDAGESRFMSENKIQAKPKIITKPASKRKSEPSRRSSRLSGVKIDFDKENIVQAEVHIPKRKFIDGPVPIQDGDINRDEITEFLHVMRSNTEFNLHNSENTDYLEEDKPVSEEIRKLEIQCPDGAVKLTADRILSSCWNPNPNNIVLTVGDKLGRLGFLKLGDGPAEEKDLNTWTLRPHQGGISNIKYSPLDFSKVYTSSYDGTIRALDIQNQVFDQIYRCPDEFMICAMDVFSSNLYFTNNNGDFCHSDTRTNSVSITNISHRKVCSVHVNPRDSNLILTSGLNQEWNLWDLRKFGKPLDSFTHGKSCTSAYWNRNGSKIVSTSYDDHVRIFDYPKKEKSPSVSIKHYNQTGRWVTNFRAIFHPDSSKDLVFVGNMDRKIDCYSSITGRLIHQLQHPEFVTAIPSVISVHPNSLKTIISSANASGKVLVCKNLTKGYSEIQIKVREATSNDPNGPSGALMMAIAEATFNQHEFMEAFYILDKRLNDHGKNWRHVYKALVVLDYLLRYGSEAVIEYSKENVHVIKTLKEFQYIDDDGRDQGINVRQKSKEVTALLSNDELLNAERKKIGGSRQNLAFSYRDAMNSDYARPAYDPEDAELKRAIEESKKTAEREEKLRQQERKSEEDLAKALMLSEEESRLNREKELQKDQIDFFSPIQEIKPVIQMVNPYEWQQHQLIIQQQEQQRLFQQEQLMFQRQQEQLALQKQQELLLLEQQRQIQQQMEFQAAQQKQRELEMFQQQQKTSYFGDNSTNPFGAASHNGASLIDTAPTEFNFVSSNALIDPFAAIATKTNPLKNTPALHNDLLGLDPMSNSNEQINQTFNGPVQSSLGITSKNTFVSPQPTFSSPSFNFTSPQPAFNAPTFRPVTQPFSPEMNTNSVGGFSSKNPFANSSSPKPQNKTGNAFQQNQSSRNPF